MRCSRPARRTSKASTLWKKTVTTVWNLFVNHETASTRSRFIEWLRPYRPWRLTHAFWPTITSSTAHCHTDIKTPRLRTTIEPFRPQCLNAVPQTPHRRVISEPEAHKGGRRGNNEGVVRLFLLFVALLRLIHSRSIHEVTFISNWNILREDSCSNHLVY